MRKSKERQDAADWEDAADWDSAVTESTSLIDDRIRCLDGLATIRAAELTKPLFLWLAFLPSMARSVGRSELLWYHFA
jgi:hypothetical protein